jgi:hypothetical protein
VIHLTLHSVAAKEERTMEDIKRSLFGYNKKEVDGLILNLERENNRLKQELLGKNEAIEQLNAQLYKYQSQEELISEAIIDAKKLSKQLLDEAKQQATEMIDTANKSISDEFERFNRTMKTLNELKNKVIAQKTELSKELQEVLSRYKSAFKNSETEDFVRIKEHLEDDLTHSEELFENSKQIIYIPDLNHKN